MFIDVLDVAAKTEKWGHTVKEHYRGLGHDQQTMVIQREELVKRNINDMVAIASQ